MELELLSAQPRGVYSKSMDKIPMNECKHDSVVRIGKSNLIRCEKCDKIIYREFDKVFEFEDETEVFDI